ncbi:inositol monophosphatase family protein [Acidobacteriota bacterium]
MLEKVVEIAKEAGGFLIENFGRITFEVAEKRARDFVTEIDLKAEEIIIRRLKESFPGTEILAEESGGERTQEGDLWIVDPLDGTTNFIHKVPIFAVSIAFLSNGQRRLGVVYDPSRDEVFSAEKNKGTWLNGQPATVSKKWDTADALIATGFPFRSLDIIDPYLECFKKIFLKIAGMRRAGSASLDLCYVASGRYDGFWEFGLSPWDIAAGSLLVEEAGGVVTDFWGGKDFLWRGDIVTGSQSIHKALVTETKASFNEVRPDRDETLTPSQKKASDRR